MTNVEAILDRIVEEVFVRTGRCNCIGCNNRATHTHGGRPTCNACATPLSGRNHLPDTKMAPTRFKDLI